MQENNNKITVYYEKTPVSFLEFTILNGVIIKIRFTKEKSENKNIASNIETIKLIQNQIKLYFNKEIKHFSLPYSLQQLPEYSKKVLKTTAEIPYGSTLSYAEIALKSGKPKAYRAVGNILNKNPLPLIIPCHRVISTNGKLTGYNFGIEIKRFLLDLEGFL